MQKRLSLLAATLLVVATTFLIVEKADAFNISTPTITLGTPTTVSDLYYAGRAVQINSGVIVYSSAGVITATGMNPSLVPEPTFNFYGTNTTTNYDEFWSYAWTGSTSGSGYVRIPSSIYLGNNCASGNGNTNYKKLNPIQHSIEKTQSIVNGSNVLMVHAYTWSNNCSSIPATIFMVYSGSTIVTSYNVTSVSGYDFNKDTYFIPGTSYFTNRNTTSWRLFRINSDASITLIQTTTTPASYVAQATYILYNWYVGTHIPYCYTWSAGKTYCTYKGAGGLLNTVWAENGTDVSFYGSNQTPFIPFDNGFSTFGLPNSLWQFQSDGSFTVNFNSYNHQVIENSSLPTGYALSVANGRAYFQLTNNTYRYWDLACQQPLFNTCEFSPSLGNTYCTDGAGNIDAAVTLCNGSTSAGAPTGTGTTSLDLFDGTGATYVADDTLVWSSYSGATCGTRGTKWSCQNDKGICIFDEPTGLCGKSIWYNNDNFSCQIQGNYCMPISSTGSSIPSTGGNGQLSGTGTYSFGSGQTIGVLSSTGSTDNGGLNMTDSVCKDMFAANGKFLYSLKAGSGVLNSNGPMSAFAGSGSVLDGLGMGDIFQSLTEITSMSSFMDAAFGIPKQGHEYCFMGQKVYMPVKYGLGTDIPDEWKTLWDPNPPGDFVSDDEHFKSLPGGTFYKKPWNCLGGLKYVCLEGTCNTGIGGEIIHNKRIDGCYVSYSMQDITPDNPNPKGTKKLSTEVGDSLGMTLLDYVVLFLLGYAVIIRIMKFTKFESETPKQDS